MWVGGSSVHLDYKKLESYIFSWLKFCNNRHTLAIHVQCKNFFLSGVDGWGHNLNIVISFLVTRKALSSHVSVIH